ncbi:MAG: hypothetical protein HRU24_13275 [Gammaproteobacteria bacterium]|nr:hypothetical protein [Gammaproteobacteria bacterium]
MKTFKDINSYKHTFDPNGLIFISMMIGYILVLSLGFYFNPNIILSSWVLWLFFPFLYMYKVHKSRSIIQKDFVKSLETFSLEELILLYKSEELSEVNSEFILTYLNENYKNWSLEGTLEII